MTKLEWLLAWRMISASRKSGGITVMSWISILGIALAVAALIVTLSVRTGFRADFLNTLLSSNAHITLQSLERETQDGRVVKAFDAGMVDIPYDHFPAIRGQVMATGDSQGGADIHGVPQDAFALLNLDIEGTTTGLVVGVELAQTLGVTIGDSLRLVSSDGPRTPFGVSPRVSSFEVTGIFESGRYDVDRSRVYMPFTDAQSYFNRTDLVDEYHLFIQDPETVDTHVDILLGLLPPGSQIWTWKDRAGGFLKALDLEDRVMFILLTALVSIAAMTIISGLVMLARNKQSTIGILRTLGMSQAGVGRIFFLCGSMVGLAGTVLGTALGCWMALNLDILLMLAGGEWDPSVRGLYDLPSALTGTIVANAIFLAMGLSMVATLIPAWQAARLAPVEALDD